jgi:hypothetical protein
MDCDTKELGHWLSKKIAEEKAQPEIRLLAHGTTSWLDRAMSGRTKRLKALGNSVVPEEAEWLGRQILLFDQQLMREEKGEGKETAGCVPLK